MNLDAIPTPQQLVREPLRVAFDTKEAAIMLGLSVTTVRSLLANGRLGYTTAGNRVVISRRHIESFLASPPEREVSRPGYGRTRRRRRTSTEADHGA